jgi:23S rRNA (cytosine1962-C5)-methyltransferase
MLAAGARSALAVDGSAAALELAQEGARRSGAGERFSTLRSDAFDAMRGLAQEGRRFDVVICDPPAFAPSKSALANGLRAYEKVARLAARLVRPGGWLGLCSCSHAADLESFRAACARGVAAAGRKGAIAHTGGAGPDHPAHPMLSESGYLKAIFLGLE